MVDEVPARIRPIQARPLVSCRVLLLYAEADRDRVAPLAELLSKSGARLDARVTDPSAPFDPGWIAGPALNSDRVVVAWSLHAAECAPLAQILDSSGALYRNRLFVMPIDASAVPERFTAYRRPRLSAALAAIGSGDARDIPTRLGHRRRDFKRLHRYAILSGAFGVVCAVFRPFTADWLSMGLFSALMLSFGTTVVLTTWWTTELRYLRQRVALLLADRELD